MDGPVIHFNSRGPNQLLLNPRLSKNEVSVLQELKEYFEREAGAVGYFFIASSGSSQQSGSSVKLIALEVGKVLNSASRFNHYFNTGKNAHWGLVLPDFHIAGLSIRARSFLAGSKVFVEAWPVRDFANQMQLISLVPAQIFDLVQMKVKAPQWIAKVFVGASGLNPELREQALKLGWPLVETFGMTETASMIAVKNDEYYKPFPGVETQIVSGRLSVRCDSLMTASLQKVNGEIVTKFPEEGWLLTEDRAELTEAGFKLLGRDADYIKVLGEGVSLVELRLHLTKLAPNALVEIVAIEDARAGSRLILAVDSEAAPVAAEMVRAFNQQCRPFEKILNWVVVKQWPKTDLGKLKIEELKRIVRAELKED